MTDGVSRFDAFLSYARDDDIEFRNQLRSGLSDAGLSVWFDRDALPNRGATFDQEIRRAIESSDRLLLIVESAAMSSSYVAQEWGFADDLGLPVVPILRAGTFDDIPAPLRSNHSVDARPPRTMDDIVSEIVRLLSDRPQPLGTLHLVPARQANEQLRAQLLETVSTTLGLDRQRPRDAGRAPRAAALYGISGSGKSTVAAAFARVTRTRRSFPDGIFWVTCGPSFQPLAAARALLSNVAVGARLPTTPEEVSDVLAAGIGTREILVVLDDVRDANAAAPFLGALGAGGRALLTTLDQAVASNLGAVEIAVDQLDDESARRMLESWTGAPLPPSADAVLAACDGLPFALALVGAMVHNRVSWTRVVEALEARRIDLIASRFPGYPYPNLLKALGASYDALRTEDATTARCYLQLAALQPGAALTEGVMVRLWSRAGGCDPLEASLALPALERRLLLRRRDMPEGERYFLHGLHEDFVRLECDNVRALEAALVASYKADRLEADWSSLEDDGYVYQHLIAHLASSEASADLIAAVNADWVGHQLSRNGDLAQALDDVRLALDIAVRPPLDVAVVAALCLLVGRIVSTLRGAPPTLIATLAECGEYNRALSWTADKPDASERFESLCLVAQVLTEHGEIALARKVITSAAQTIQVLGGVVETGMFSGLTALNAVHSLVRFPFPDQWEGTTDSYVAIARLPLSAILRLAPIAEHAGAIAELGAVRHPFWELYAHLIPLVAVEHLAKRGQIDLARALFAQTSDVYEDDSDMAHAEQYRRAVATAAVGRFDEARSAIDALPVDYRAVGYSGLASNLAAAGRADPALELLGLIDDDTVANQALTDVVEATIQLADPAACRLVAEFALKRDLPVAAAWLLAASGEPAFGFALIEKAPSDDLRLGLGNRLGSILLDVNCREHAQHVAAELVPVAERLLGPQWFAPETTDADPSLAALGRGLLSLVARSGQPLPPTITLLALMWEKSYERVADFKLELIFDLVIACRFVEALELAEVSTVPGGVALGFATALSVANPSLDHEVCEAAVTRLVSALEGVGAGDMLDSALRAAMRMLTSNGFDDGAARLAAALQRQRTWASTVGLWTLDRAKRGDVKKVEQLVRRMLVEPQLAAANGQSRALLLSAIAARRPGISNELIAATKLLANTSVAVGCLDVVFDIVSLQAKRGAQDAGGLIARAVAAGNASDIAEQALAGDAVRSSDGTTNLDVAAAAAVRAVAAAAMAVAFSAAGTVSDDEWMTRAESLAAIAIKTAPELPISAAVAKYVGAARAVTRSKVRAAADIATTHAVSRLLWNLGRTEDAIRIAREVLRISYDPLRGPQVITVEEFERRSSLDAAARAGLESIVATEIAADGRGVDPSTLAFFAKLRTESSVWLGLTLAERSEFHASIAIGLACAGQADLAAAQLQQGSSDAITLARRGEVGPFDTLCQALTEVLPLDRANAVWAAWVNAASESGASEALILIAAYVRWSREIDLSSVVVNPETGELRHRT